MATYRFPPALTLLAWEEELRRGHYSTGRTWSGSPVDSLALDFSAVEFVDFSALACSLLMVDAAVRREIPASVKLPATSIAPDRGQVDGWSALAARRVRARGDAVSFMRHTGFLDSLRAPHWDPGAVRVLDPPTDSQEPIPALSPGRQPPDLDSEPNRRRRVFPFRWLEPMPTAQLRESESFLTVSAGLEDIGLSKSDAQTLSQTVLTELVENVAAHSSDGERPTFALVGAMLISAETYLLRQSGLHGHMAEVAERALADRSHVLRLIVADSGANLAARLMPPQDQDTSPERRQESILAALGDRPAAAASGTARRRGATGLPWVARVVRSYRGGVQARTADLLTGLTFGREDGGAQVRMGRLGYVPGTLLELTLLTGPTPPRPRISWGSLTAPGSAPHLSWMSCAFDPRHGLSDADRTRLAEHIRASRADQRADGLVVTVPLHERDNTGIDDRWRGAIYRLLEFVSSIARWGTVVVIFPDAEPHILDPCVAVFNEELPAAPGQDAHDPILVVGRHGEPIWCGGSSALRAVLRLLSEENGAVSLGRAQACWQQAGGDPGGFAGTLHESAHLIAAAGYLRLRLSPLAVHGSVARAVGQQVLAAIDRGAAGVECGSFRGPTLHLSRRWIHVEELLAGTVGHRLAAFVLARKVEAALQAAGRREVPTGIVRVRSTPRPVARSFSECLALGGRYYAQQSELNIGEPPIGDMVPAGARLVLCTDLICTDNTVRRAIAMIVSRDAEPIAVACVIDARRTHGPVRLLNRSVPVVSLIEADLGVSKPPPGGEIIDIDPLMLRPVAGGMTDVRPADEMELLTWFAAVPDVLRLGHIDDPPRKHYSAFVRLQAMRQPEEQAQIMTAIHLNVHHALADIQVERGAEDSVKAPVAVWYVADDGNAGWLAQLVHEYLAAEGFQVSSLVPIPRWTSGDAWAFPANLGDRTEQLGVLIIHWWAITGSTLLQLVWLAAKSGAAWIVALCMLNQLDGNNADALRMLRAVSEPATTTGMAASPYLRRIPVAIRFVAVSGITAFDAHGCPICATRRRYELDDEAAVPPRLAQHARLLHEILRPRELDEVARDSAADLFLVPLTEPEAADYLRWHGLLLRALRTVSARQEVIDRLRALTSEAPRQTEWTSAGLIRLLAAEQQWLRLPPLYFAVAADLLSRVCVDSFEQLTAPPWLRLQALMVISAAVPQHLAELLPQLVASAGHEAVLVDEMLFDCFRLLLRSAGDPPVDVSQLRYGLVAARDYLEEQRDEQDAGPAGDRGPDTQVIEDHMYAIRNLLTIANYRVLSKPVNPQAAWESLREDLVRPVVRHRLEADLLLVRGFVEDIERVRPTLQMTRAASADWDTCVRQLEERALVNLPPLRDILAGDFVADWLGHRDQRRLLTLARPGVGELREVTDRLHALSHGAWRPADPSWQAVRRELLDRINWWNRTFLAAHLPDHDVAAHLVELIKSAPVRLGPCLHRFFQAHQVEVNVRGEEHGEKDVFCPERLLEQIVGHLLDNVAKHRIEGTDLRFQVEYQPPRQGLVPVIVRNSGTASRTPPGRGLRSLNDKLKPFGGSLIGQVLSDDGWTFAAVLALPVWHGG